MANNFVNQSRNTSRSAYSPITLQDVHPKSQSPLFEGLESTSSRTLAGVLFAAIFVLSRGLLQFSGLILLVLLICVLYRMSPRERRIAGIPLAFSAIRIALGFTFSFGTGLLQSNALNTANSSFEAGLYWMPLLFSAYLFYSPWKDSFTSRVIFWYALSLLLSGLLPGDGYLYVSAMLFYTLFIALAIGLILDFSQDKGEERRAFVPPQPPVPPAQTAFS